MKKLEIGPGKTKIDKDWVTVNVIKSKCTDVVAEWGDKPLPFDDKTFDLIYASHCLEHVAWHATDIALKDAYRILKSNGTIEVWVPDFQYIINCYKEHKCGDAWRKHNAKSNYMKWVNGRIFTYGHSPHYAVFDAAYLEERLKSAGFKDIKRLKEPRSYDHGKINLGMSGRK